jgi:MazG family protein
MDSQEAAKAFGEFISVIKALRTPGSGCPWDLEQTHHSLRPFLIEESYEVLDALERGDDAAFCDELGDLLLQVVLHAQIAEDRGAFSITEVTRGIERKMVRRHPHVFGEAVVAGSSEVLRNWEQIKAAERQARGEDTSPAGALARLPEGMPALMRAQRLGEKASKNSEAEPVLHIILEQMRGQVAQLQKAIEEIPGASKETAPADDMPRATAENALGELLFSLCQLARRTGLSAEDCLRAKNKQFVEIMRRPEKPSTP